MSHKWRRWPVFQKVTYQDFRRRLMKKGYLEISLALRTALLKLL
jgi:hypothetical protein